MRFPQRNPLTIITNSYCIVCIVGIYTDIGSRHSSYTSHQSRISYTSHGDLLGGMAVMGVSTMTKESKLRNRNTRNQSVGATNGGTTCLDTNHKVEHRDYVSTESYHTYPIYALLNRKFLLHPYRKSAWSARTKRARSNITTILLLSPSRHKRWST